MRYITKTDLLIVARDSGYLMMGIGIMCLIPLIFDLIYFEFDVISFLIRIDFNRLRIFFQKIL